MNALQRQTNNTKPKSVTFILSELLLYTLCASSMLLLSGCETTGGPNGKLDPEVAAAFSEVRSLLMGTEPMNSTDAAAGRNDKGVGWSYAKRKSLRYTEVGMKNNGSLTVVTQQSFRVTSMGDMGQIAINADALIVWATIETRYELNPAQIQSIFDKAGKEDHDEDAESIRQELGRVFVIGVEGSKWRERNQHIAGAYQPLWPYGKPFPWAPMKFVNSFAEFFMEPAPRRAALKTALERLRDACLKAQVKST